MSDIPGRERQPHEHRDRPRRRGRGQRGDPHRRGPRLRRATAPPVRSRAVASCSPRATNAASASPRASRSASCPRPRDVRAGDWRVPPPPDALIDRRVEITGPAIAREDGHQRAELGRAGLARRHGGRVEPDLGERRRQRAQPARCGTRHPRLHLARGQGLRAAHRRAPPDRRHPSARLAPAREARARRRRTRLGVARRLRAALLPHRAAAHRQRRRPVLLPAEAREPPRGATLERRVRVRAGGARHPAGHRAGDRADRDDHRGVRDGRDPLRAARAHVGPQRGPLGLPVQHHQGVPRRRTRVHRARPGRRCR